MSYRQAFSSLYARNFDRRPWITLAVTNGILGVAADGAAQTLERISQSQSREQGQQRIDSTAEKIAASVSSANHAGQDWDWSRSGRFLAFNVAMAPLLAEWNKFLEFRFPLRATTPTAPSAGGPAGTLGKVSLRALGSRVAMDQVFL